jgi:hypothetical protein
MDRGEESGVVMDSSAAARSGWRVARSTGFSRKSRTPSRLASMGGDQQDWRNGVSQSGAFAEEVESVAVRKTDVEDHESDTPAIQNRGGA